MAPELGWDEARVNLEIERFREEAAAEGLLVDAGATG
jgi:hypothetical protein